MKNLKIKIEQVKNIKSAVIEFPLEQSVSLIVGSNGSGKSTILLALSQAIRKSLRSLNSDDYNKFSKVEIGLDGKVDVWSGANDWADVANRAVSLRGMYEGSLFYGTRFNDSRTVDGLLKSGDIAAEDIVDADDYVKEKLSQILTGTANKYKDLKRIKNRSIAQRLRLTSTPYFNSINGNLISQYRMSSGECLLISLLHFLYNAIFRRSLAKDQLILVLIDEIELALHPIAVSRFIDLINELVHNAPNLMVILTSHSPEVIRKIEPKNIYKIENNAGIVDVVNPGYPSYVIRDVYRHDGFDFLLLVEDILAKVLVEKILESKNLGSSKLVNVVPVGGYANVLTLQRDLLRGNVLGVGREIISILDGDVADKVSNEFGDMKKLFLPIKSVEKLLYSIVIEGANPALKKIINDKYFQLDSLDSLAAEHNQQYGAREKVEQPDKKFYFRIRKNLENRGIDELMFVQKLSDDIIGAISFEKFSNSLERMLKK
ncbi:AAA family ATPase [Caballeronia sp. ATUFL_F2_KS9A]|uniref:ATP-dependent nuclease n=1 Tax=Caballeronia sp. ATUFL_F2_KS9A TaxID=2921777 RepID=UPI002027B6B3|nr:AAA family ATPase [Caballeronia sp. ATUFL_F2_KS9A]